MRRAVLLVACTTMCAARRAVPRWVAPRGGAADDEPAAYRPRTKEARAAYEAVLAGVRRTLGDVPRDVLAGAADEALHVLKDEAAADGDRRAKLERLLGARLGDEQFSELAALGRKVTDFTPDQTPTGQAGADDGGLDEEMGVAVVFDEDESDDEERARAASPSSRARGVVSSRRGGPRAPPPSGGAGSFRAVEAGRPPLPSAGSRRAHGPAGDVDEVESEEDDDDAARRPSGHRVVRWS